MPQDNLEIIKNYNNAWLRGDFSKVMFADNFEFHGPNSYYNNAEDYITENLPKAKAIDKVNIHKMFSDGDEACSIYDVFLKKGSKIPMAEWFSFENGKIKKICVFFGDFPKTD